MVTASASDGLDVPFNFSRVTERLLLGSRPWTEADIAKLRAENVTHIIDVCMDDDQPLLATVAGISGYLWNPTPDDGRPKQSDWFLKSVRFAMPVLAQAGWTFYVHCHDGVNRGPSTAYVIMRAQGLSHLQAKLMICAARQIDVFGIRYADDADKAIHFGW